MRNAKRIITILSGLIITLLLPICVQAADFGTIAFSPGAGSGTMAAYSVTEAGTYTIPQSEFGYTGYEFTGWLGTDGEEYSPGDTVTVAPGGGALGLIAQWQQQETPQDGTYDVYLHAGETFDMSDIPAGTAYSIWEETPDGWVLLEQSNASGKVEPLETAAATFTNQYQPGTTTVQFSGIKTLDGNPVGADDYQFRLTENGNTLETVATLDGGFFQFSPITYDDTMLGTHVYKIAEVDPEDERIDYDRHVETITVEVIDNGDGTLRTEITYDHDGVSFAGNTPGGGSGDIVFSNTTRPGKLRISKDATHVTDANKDDVFTFKITFTNAGGKPISDEEEIYWYTEDEYGHEPETTSGE